MGTGLTTREVFGDVRTTREDARVDLPPRPGARLGKVLLVGVAGGAAYLLALVVIAVAAGRPALYPLRAIYAIFNGNRYLPEYSIVSRDYGVFQVVKSLGWVTGIGAAAAVLPAMLAPRWNRGNGLLAWLALAVGWSMTLFVVAYLVIGMPGAPTVQRAGTSFQGVRDLGLWMFAVAHLVYGVVIALLLRRGARA